MSPKRLEGEIALITGADSGIGQAIAIAFAREGADVAITYFHDEKGIEETRRQVEKAGRRVLVSQLDQRDPAAVAYFFQQIQRELGLATILVNNAGINGVVKPLHQLTNEEWDDVIRTDLYGPFYCCREFILALEGVPQHGNIINITSVHEEIPMAGASAYDAAKGGLRNLTRTLALELSQKNINVNNIAPGMVLTPMNQEDLDDLELQARDVQAIPMRRAALPEEIANVAVFLASAEARYVQGATIMVDGALTLAVGQMG
jgi:glucose 1-dehydrogenase